MSSKLAHSVRTKLEFREGVNFVVKFVAVTASFCAQTIYSLAGRALVRRSFLLPHKYTVLVSKRKVSFHQVL